MAEWLLLAGVCLMGAMIPGANTAIVLRSTLTGNKRNAFITVAGLTCAISIHVLFSMLGLTALISETPSLYEPIRWSGSAYLLYMGITYLLIRANTANPETCETSFQHPFLSGLMISLLNPKVLLMFMALFSQILNTEHSWQVKIAYGLTPVIAEAGWLCLIILVLSRPAIQQRLNQVRHKLERVIGAGLVVLGIKVGLG
ncbi:MAG: LysE family translocator [Pontibacterium sp.]